MTVSIRSFGGLERFEQFIQAGLVGAGEFRPYLAYWIRSICEEANPDLRRILNEYVAFYHFEGVGSLFQRYDKRIGRADGTQAALNHYEIQERYEEQVKSMLASENRGATIP